MLRAARMLYVVPRIIVTPAAAQHASLRASGDIYEQEDRRAVVSGLLLFSALFSFWYRHQHSMSVAHSFTAGMPVLILN